MARLPSRALIYVSVGVLTVRTESGRWVMPPGHALWLMANTLHCLTAGEPVRLYSLHADADAAPLPTLSGALVLDPLARALLSAAADLPHDQPFDEPAERLLQVLAGPPLRVTRRAAGVELAA